MDLEKQYLEIRTNELKMLKDNKDGNLRYLLAKEAISMSAEQSKAIGSALSRARIIGALKDLHQVEKMLKTPIAIREVLGEVIDIMDDEAIQGVGRFFRGVAAIRKEYQSSVVETNSSTQAASGLESEEFTTSQDGGTSSEDEIPLPHNDRDFG